MTPQEVLALCRERGIKAVDLRFMDFPGLWQHFTIPVNKLDRTCSRTAWALTARASAAGRRSTRATCSCCPKPKTAFLDPFSTLPTLAMICNIQDPITREDYTRDPAQRRPQGGQLPQEHRHRRHLLHRPRGRVLHLRRRALRPDAQLRLLLPRQHRGRVEPRHGRGPQPGLQAAAQGRLFPRAAGRPDDGHPQRDDADDDRLRHRRRGPASRGGHGRAVRNRPEVRRPGDDGRPDVHVQVHHQERRPAARQDRDLHAQAAVQRQRLRHAHAHFAVEGRQDPVRRQRLCGAERDGTARHRRHSARTRRRSWRSPTRRPTATSGWCPATRRR